MKRQRKSRQGRVKPSSEIPLASSKWPVQLCAALRQRTGKQFHSELNSNSGEGLYKLQRQNTSARKTTKSVCCTFLRVYCITFPGSNQSRRIYRTPHVRSNPAQSAFPEGLGNLRRQNSVP